MPKKIDPELKARAVRLVSEHRGEYPTLTAASQTVVGRLKTASVVGQVDDHARSITLQTRRLAHSSWSLSGWMCRTTHPSAGPRALASPTHHPQLRRAIMMGAVENKKTIKWRSKPQKHDYAAAASYLSLVFGQQAAENAARDLERAEMSKFLARDIFRASMLSLLGVSNSHVERDRAKIILDEKLSPLLLFRDKRNGKVIVTDGYHRLCAVYTFNENAMIPCKIAGPD